MKVLKGILVVMAMVGLVMASGIVAEEAYEEGAIPNTAATDVWLSRLIGQKVVVSFNSGGRSKETNGTVVCVGDAGVVLKDVKGYPKGEHFFSFGSVVTISRHWSSK